MANTYQKDDTVRFSVTYKVAGALTDPTIVTFRLRDPPGTATAYVYGTDAEVVKDSTGTYHADIVLATEGVWPYRWEGTGTAAGSKESLVTVEESAF